MHSSRPFRPLATEHVEALVAQPQGLSLARVAKVAITGLSERQLAAISLS